MLSNWRRKAPNLTAYIDPAARPLAAEQSSPFFRLPREVRDGIYELVFGTTSLCSNDKDAEPLLACRQFYIEARSTAFSNIQWSLNWNLMAQLLMDRDRWQPPFDFTIADLISQAPLSEHHHMALRRMRRMKISHYWTIAAVSERFPIDGLLYHFIVHLSSFLASDMQLDCLIIEREDRLNSMYHKWQWLLHQTPSYFIFHEWKANMALLWSKRVAKSILVLDSDGYPDFPHESFHNRPAWGDGSTSLWVYNRDYIKLHGLTSENVYYHGLGTAAFSDPTDGYSFEAPDGLLPWDWTLSQPWYIEEDRKYVNSFEITQKQEDSNRAS